MRAFRLDTNSRVAWNTACGDQWAGSVSCSTCNPPSCSATFEEHHAQPRSSHSDAGVICRRKRWAMSAFRFKTKKSRGLEHRVRGPVGRVCQLQHLQPKNCFINRAQPCLMLVQWCKVMCRRKRWAMCAVRFEAKSQVAWNITCRDQWAGSVSCRFCASQPCSLMHMGPAAASSVTPQQSGSTQTKMLHIQCEAEQVVCETT